MDQTNPATAHVVPSKRRLAIDRHQEAARRLRGREPFRQTRGTPLGPRY
jgi:hypothetical protein